MRRKIVAGNWKMNLTLKEAQTLASEIRHLYWAETEEKVLVILAPPSPFLATVAQETKDKASVAVAAQNMHQEAHGAFTGEVSGPMLKSVGCEYVILGHSERRNIFGEDNALLARKVDAALQHELRPIFCVGERLEERESNKTMAVIEQQIKEGCFHLSDADFGKLIIAYEPVWAIGTGKTATPEQAQEVHSYIRGLIQDQYNEQVAEQCSLLYGGSVNPGNAWDLFAQRDVDGGLVGGASLKSEAFIKIIKAME